MSESLTAAHPIPPIYNAKSKILILGSFPSVRSREERFFYAHPQNRFWKLMSALFGEPAPETAEQKTDLLLRHGLALWDVVGSCEITGSSDSSIKNVTPNDISEIIKSSEVGKIFANGAAAYKLYNKYILPKIGTDAVKLPSTSSANASCSFEKLISQWKIILNYP